jgi:hypothetical protein
MDTRYHVRWITKPRLTTIRKENRVGNAVVLDSLNGFLIVEPVGSNLGDGDVLSPQDAEWQLSPAFCLAPTAKIAQARRLLGLEAESFAESTALAI